MKAWKGDSDMREGACAALAAGVRAGDPGLGLGKLPVTDPTELTGLLEGLGCRA